MITVLGVISIFDDLEKVFKNLLLRTKKGGKIYIHGMFNTSDIDVFVQYRKSEDHESQFTEAGWNIISFASCQRILSNLGAKNVKLHTFHLGIDLPKQDDVVRSWTENAKMGNVLSQTVSA